MAQTKRRLAQAIDPAMEFITLAALRDLVNAADHERLADDSRFEIFREDSGTAFGRCFIVLNEVER